MFESVPKGDAIFMKWILHNWSDDLCIKLLKNCYDAIPSDGKVIVVEVGMGKRSFGNRTARCGRLPVGNGIRFCQPNTVPLWFGNRITGITVSGYQAYQAEC